MKKPLIPATEPHEVTPQIRQRTQRTFFLILGVFATGIMLMIAALAFKGSAVRGYGQAVLKAYQAHKKSGASNAAFDIPCQNVFQEPRPGAVQECQVKVWGEQAVVYLRSEDTKITLVGRFTSPAIASEQELERYVSTLVKDFQRWLKTPEYAAWLKNQHSESARSGFGLSVNCAVFSHSPLPAGIKSCIQGPGPSDSPTIRLELVDGRVITRPLR